MTHKPVNGVKRPAESNIGKTPALGTAKRDRAIHSPLFFHGLRRAELCAPTVKDATRTREGVPHLKVYGKGGKSAKCR